LNLVGAIALSLTAAGWASAEQSPGPAHQTAKAAPATAADIKAGAPLRDVDNAPVGMVVSSSDQQVVVDTGQTKIGVPLALIQKDDKGLLLSITGKQFSDAIAKAHARAQAQQQQPATGQESH
jgi:hypothetical protein